MRSAIGVVVGFVVLLGFGRMQPAQAAPRESHSTEFFVAGDGALPPAYAAIPALAGYRAGYRCPVTKMLGVYLSVRTDQCRPAFAKDGVVAEEPLEGVDAGLPDAIKAHRPPSTIKLSGWIRFGKFAIGGALAIVFFVIPTILWFKRRGKPQSGSTSILGSVVGSVASRAGMGAAGSMVPGLGAVQGVTGMAQGATAMADANRQIAEAQAQAAAAQAAAQAQQGQHAAPTAPAPADGSAPASPPTPGEPPTRG
jgi:hypothetical protein